MTKTISDSTLDALREIDSATISNAIEMFKVRGLTEGYASMELRCRFLDRFGDLSKLPLLRFILLDPDQAARSRWQGHGEDRRHPTCRS